MQATTAIQVHELFAGRFNAQDADGIIKLCQTNAVILPPDVPEMVSVHVAIRAMPDGFIALKEKMEITLC